MSSYGKCVIVIYSDYHRIIEKHVNLEEYSFRVDILPHHKLECKRGTVWVIDELNECKPCYVNLDLASCYRQQRKSGESNVATAYYSPSKFTFYSVEDSRPRYLIWPEGLTSPINCTYIDRVSIFDLLDAFQRAVDWSKVLWSMSAQEISLASIAVIDLDSTCIKHRDNGKCEQIDVTLTKLRRKFDILVLWSHGTAPHVDQFHSNKFFTSEVKFDLVLCNEKRDERAPKNLLFLYNYFPNVRFTKSLLVDDLKENITPEYSMIVIPQYENTFAIKELLA
jgi:hypothetical protein